MLSENIRTEKYRDDITRILNRPGYDEENIEYVEDVHEWEKKNYPETLSHPFTIAMCRPNPETGATLIVIKENISSSYVVQSIFPAMELRRLSEVTERLEDDWYFIQHTILHEIAHSKGINNETEADIWADKNMIW